MKCKDIRELIVSYLENGLDPETNRELQEHIKSCKDCSKELLYHKKYFTITKKLPEVPAPEGFLRELHVAIDKSVKSQTLIDRLFKPFIIKIPLEAAGVVALTVLVFFIFQPHKLFKKPMHISMKTADHIVADSKSLDIKKKDHITDNTKLLNPTMPTKRRKISKESIFADKDKELDSKLARTRFGRLKKKNVFNGIEEKKQDPFKQSEKRSNKDGTSKKTYSKRADSTTSDDYHPNEIHKGSGTLGGNISQRQETPVYHITIQVQRREIYSSGKSENTPSLNIRRSKKKEEVKSKSTTRERNVGVQYMPESRINKIIKSVKGKILKKSNKITQGESKKIIIEIPANKYARFIQELNSIGKIQKKPASIKKTKHKMRFQLEYNSSY